MQAYSVKTSTCEIAEFSRGMWVRLSGKSVRISGSFDTALLTAGMPTDTPWFVEGVEAFYVFLRRETIGGDRWRFRSEELARQAYEMLIKIAEMYL